MDVQTIIDAAGGEPQLGTKLRVARTTILDWKRSGTIPANRVAQISEELGLPLEEVVKLAPKPKAPVDPQAVA